MSFKILVLVSLLAVSFATNDFLADERNLQPSVAIGTANGC
jgi:hypothetical protein